MHLYAYQRLWFLSLGATSVLGAFNDFQFAGNKGNNSAVRTCGTGVGSLPYGCLPPSMCSRDTLTQKWYCCNPGSSDAVCWTAASKCEGSGTGEPATGQLGCQGGATKYCCLDQNERCTQVVGQFNICWSNFDNPLRPLNATRLNETFNSLSSSSPSATAYPITRSVLNEYTSTTPGATPSTSASASASTSPSPPPSSSPAPSSSGLSGGAIGGIVGGIVGGLALIGVAAFLLWRRKRATQGKIDPHAQPGDPYQGYAYQPSYPQGQGHSPQPPVAQLASTPASQPVPLDKYAHVGQAGVAEAPATQAPVEMDASYYSQTGGRGPK